MNNRRSFLYKLAGLGASMPFISSISQARTSPTRKKAKFPIILTSRGEDWGKKTLKPAWKKLKETGSILDAIEAGAHITELDPEDMSVGYGGLPNEDGIVTLDASIMYGPTHNCGSVSALEGIKTPSSVARLVMERTDHMMLVGEGAQQFAIAHGFQVENLLTEKARLAWLRWKENLSDRDDWLPPADGNYEPRKRPTGTINVIGIDENGDIAGLTTTSGLFGKIPGRIGDSPIIGAGIYVDNAVGAAGATGRGEEVIRTCGSFLVVEFMRQGMSPQAACEAVCKRIVELNGGIEKVNFDDKFVAVNKAGEVGVASILGEKGKHPFLAYMTQDGFEVVEGTFMKEFGS